MAYPATIDTMASVNSAQTLAQAGHAARHNELATTVNSLQSTLGVNPQGGSATVVLRLNAVDSSIALKANASNPVFTGIQSNPSGTAAAPSITFTGSTTNGFYLAGTNQLGLTTAGVQRATIDSTGLGVTGTIVASSTIAGSGLAGSLLSSATPAALGTATAGTSTTPSRQDHVHSNINVALTTPTITNATINNPTIDSAYLISPSEKITVSATAANTSVNFDAITQAILYYTTNASANWTFNIRGDSGTTLNSIMSTGESLSVLFLVTNGATAYYHTALTIDGVSVTPKWSGGTAPISGNINAIDAYSFTVVKTGTSTYTVFAAQGKYA